MTQGAIDRMDAARLEKLSKFLFPNKEENWKQSIGNAMGVHVTTVRRWIHKDTVPLGYAIAIECLTSKKLEYLKETTHDTRK